MDNTEEITSGLDIEYDEKRCGWWVSGSGFDFFAYMTSDDHGNNFIECDHVVREGSSLDRHITIAYGGAKKLTSDVLETALLIELRKYW